MIKMTTMDEMGNGVRTKFVKYYQDCCKFGNKIAKLLL